MNESTFITETTGLNFKTFEPFDFQFQIKKKKTNQNVSKSNHQIQKKNLISPENLIPQERISEVKDELLNGESPSCFSAEELEAALPLVKSSKMEAVKDGDYLEADRIKKIQSEMSRIYQLQKYAKTYQTRVSSALSKQQKANEEYDNLIDFWDSKVTLFDNELVAKRDNLLEKQQQELDEFDQKAQEMTENAPFKPSPHILALKRKEQGLVRAERYLEAANVRQTTTFLSNNQAEICKIRMANDCKLKRKALKSKHKAQMQAFMRWADGKRIQLLKEREEAISVAEQRAIRFDSELQNIENHGISAKITQGIPAYKFTKKESHSALMKAMFSPHQPQHSLSSLSSKQLTYHENC